MTHLPLPALAILVLALLLPLSADARDPLPLDEARAQMHARNFQFEVLARQVDQAALLTRQARAILLPSINVTGIYTLNDQAVTFEQPNVYAPLGPYLEEVYQGSPSLQQFLADNPDVPDARNLAEEEFPAAVIQYRHDWRGIATVTQTLFNARAMPLLRLAELTQDQAAQGADVLRYELDAALLRLYFQALATLRMVEIAERNADTVALEAERARRALEEGVGTAFEARRSEVFALRSQRDLEATRRSYDMILEAIALLLNREADFDVVEPPALERTEGVDALERELVRERPDMEALRRQLAIDEVSIRESRAQFWPVVFAQAQGTLQRSSAFAGDPFRWAISVQASWDIFDGGLRRAEREGRELQAMQTEIRLEERERAIWSELRQAFIELASQEQQLEGARAEAELAYQSWQLSEQARELGVASALDVEVALQQRFLAEVAAESARIAVQQQLYDILLRSGRF